MHQPENLNSPQPDQGSTEETSSITRRDVLKTAWVAPALLTLTGFSSMGGGVSGHSTKKKKKHKKKSHKEINREHKKKKKKKNKKKKKWW